VIKKMMEEQFLVKLNTYKNMVYRLAIAYLKNVQDAEDTTQDVFMKLYRQDIKGFSAEQEKAWLIRVTINACKDILKSAWRRRTTPLDENVAFCETEQSDLFYAVMALSLKYRMVIHLYYYEDYPVKEIADILHIKETTVQTRLMRARRKLQEILEKENHDTKEGYYEKNIQGNI
jgi:RNA polymerase sigma-70 factor (ECF subfamily)